MNIKRSKIWLYIGIIIVIASVVLLISFTDIAGVEAISIWNVIFFGNIMFVVMISIFKSELFNASNKVIAAIPSDTGDNNSTFNRFRLGHESFPRAANIIDEVVKYQKPDGTVANVRFRGAYVGYNKIVRTNPGNTLFIGVDHKMMMCGGDIIMLGKMVRISPKELFKYVGKNTGFYNRIARVKGVRPGIKKIYVPSSISDVENMSTCSIVGNYRLDEPTGKRFNVVVEIIEDRLEKIFDYSEDGWDSFQKLHKNLLEVLRAQKAHSIAVRDAKGEMNQGGFIRPRQKDEDRKERRDV
jgi:hypothetical protein